MFGRIGFAGVIAGIAVAFAAPAMAQAATPAPTVSTVSMVKAPVKASTKIGQAFTPLYLGKVSTASGILYANGKPAANQTLVLQARVPGSSTWTTVATAKTNGTGWATFTFTAKGTRDYKTVFQGSATLKPAATSVVRVAALKAPTFGR